MDDKQSNSTSSKNSSIEKLKHNLESLGSIRNGLLVSVGIVYIIGYLVWGINAWQKQLGHIPVINSQYFVAGIFPTLLGIISWILIKGAIQLPNRLDKFYYKKEQLSKILVIAFGVFACCFLIVNFMKFEKAFPELDRIISPIVSFFFIALFIVSPWGLKTLRKIYTVFLVVALCTLALAIYLKVLYPNLPQELGGLRPRPALLDINGTQLSDKTREAVFFDTTMIDSNYNKLSDTVDIFYVRKDFILLKPHGVNHGSVYEIKKSSINAIIWLK